MDLTDGEVDELLGMLDLAESGLSMGESRAEVKRWARRIGGQSPMAFDPDHPRLDVCRCGHTYGRHFDGYEDPPAPGCKYCGCATFVSAGYDPEWVGAAWAAEACIVPGCPCEPRGSSPTCRGHQARDGREEYPLPPLLRA